MEKIFEKIIMVLFLLLIIALSGCSLPGIDVLKEDFESEKNDVNETSDDTLNQNVGLNELQTYTFDHVTISLDESWKAMDGYLLGGSSIYYLYGDSRSAKYEYS